MTPDAFLWAHDETSRTMLSHPEDPHPGKRWRRIPLYARPPHQSPLTEDRIRELSGASDVFWATSKTWIINVVRATEKYHGVTDQPNEEPS